MIEVQVIITADSSGRIALEMKGPLSKAGLVTLLAAAQKLAGQMED